MEVVKGGYGYRDKCNAGWHTRQAYGSDVTDKVFEKASRYEDRRIEKEESKTFAGTKKTPRREDVSL